MDLEARVTALEDEVGILKGEIKSVLLEVRTAFLATHNPFTIPQLTIPAPAPAPAPAPPPPAPEAAPAPIPAVQHIGSIQHTGIGGDAGNGSAPASNNGGGFSGDEAGFEDAGPTYAANNGGQPRGNGRQGGVSGPGPRRGASYGGGWVDDEPVPARRDSRPISRIGEPVFEDNSPAEVLPATRPKFDMNTLAMLMAWTQGNMVRLNLAEMGSLLALARYGGVIERELEDILMNIAKHFENEADPRTGLLRQRPAATISEYLLALHELHTVINEDDEPAFRWLRKVG